MKSVDRLLALASELCKSSEVIARNITVFSENPGFSPHEIRILSAEIRIHSDEQCAAVKSQKCLESHEVKKICQNPLVKAA